jgi:hypothetical protein
MDKLRFILLVKLSSFVIFLKLLIWTSMKFRGKLKTPEDARGQEWAAIKLYDDKYKEPPPLNLGIRREFFAIVGIAKVGKSRVAYEPDRFVRSVINS